ncbi:MAG: single-stranded DNA-binding protein [Actinomycetaceae bacterium]|nr:single-stranded DNA-binding protein [Actinomycetaceae bacterium]
MSNETYVTVRGFVGADPMVFSNGGGGRTAIVRVGVTPRSRNRQTQQYEDGPTAWYSVRCFGDLADNVAQTIRTGAPVLVRGRLTQRTWQGRDGVERVEMAIIADSLGLELSTVAATYAKSRRAAAAQQRDSGQSPANVAADPDATHPADGFEPGEDGQVEAEHARMLADAS